MAFRKWRKSRPFWGSVLTILSGLLILWVPLNLYISTLIPGSFAIIGLLFGGLITLIGFMGLFFPNACKILGILTIFLSILSVIGALGGFLIGTLIGIISGSMLLAWRLGPVKTKVRVEKDAGNTASMG